MTEVKYKTVALAVITVSFAAAVLLSVAQFVRAHNTAVMASRAIEVTLLIVGLSALLVFAYAKSIEAAYRRDQVCVALHVGIVALSCFFYWLLVWISGGSYKIAWQPFASISMQLVWWFALTNFVTALLLRFRGVDR